MSLRKDVYELLCLYEGENPRLAFKPTGKPSRNINGKPWITEDPDNGCYLVFRSQVPDHLESACDIVLGEGLLKMHLLESDKQLELYALFGLPLPPQDKTWPIFPDNSDALMVITIKGRSAIALHSTVSEMLSERLKVDLLRQETTLDNVVYSVESPQALRWLKVLVEHPGEWISGPQLIKYDSELAGAKTNRWRKYLPFEIESLIQSETGKGSRIKLLA